MFLQTLCCLICGLTHSSVSIVKWCLLAPSLYYVDLISCNPDELSFNELLSRLIHLSEA